MGNDAADSTMTNAWRQQRTGPMKRPNKKILAIIRQEKDCSFWWRLNFALGKQVRGQSIQDVQVGDGNGRILDFNMQEEVQNAIFNEVHWKWYNLAEEASFCNGVLRGQFHYMSTLPTARSVLDGSYEFPLDIDEATKELFKECTKVRLIVPANLIIGMISRERWHQLWKKVKEDTSLSLSGLHFGHYISGADCDYISQF
jgi:hypothetical protein